MGDAHDQGGIGRWRASRSTSAKLALLILIAAGSSVALLGFRQSRLESVGAMAASLRRSAELDRQLQSVRVEIARRLRPDRVAKLAERLGPLRSGEAGAGDPDLYASGTPSSGEVDTRILDAASPPEGGGP
jgi:hypothetical protein